MLGVELAFLFGELVHKARYSKLNEKDGLAMRGSHNETITRLEAILREVECELLYLINDICVDDAAVGAGQPPLRRLEVARHCVSAAERALRVQAAAELVGADG